MNYCAYQKENYDIIPDGWEVAPYSADVVKDVVRNNKFGTKEVVFANGNSYLVNRHDTHSSNNQDYLHVDDYGVRT